MPQRDIYHDAVKNALIKDGWTITHDPYRLPLDEGNVFVDLGAETLAAEQAGRKIAVEIKSFLGKSPVADLEQALGQYILYRTLLLEHEPGRDVFLALPQEAWSGVLSRSQMRGVLAANGVKLLIFERVQEEIIEWSE